MSTGPIECNYEIFSPWWPDMNAVGRQVKCTNEFNKKSVGIFVAKHLKNVTAALDPRIHKWWALTRTHQNEEETTTSLSIALITFDAIVCVCVRLIVSVRVGLETDTAQYL